MLENSAVFTWPTCDASTACSADTDPSPTTKLNSRIRSLSSALALISSGESKGARKQGGEMGDGDGGGGWVWVGGWRSSTDRVWVED